MEAEAAEHTTKRILIIASLVVFQHQSKQYLETLFLSNIQDMYRPEFQDKHSWVIPHSPLWSELRDVASKLSQFRQNRTLHALGEQLQEAVLPNTTDISSSLTALHAVLWL